MNYDLILTISEESPQGQNIESLVTAERISRQEAALQILASRSPKKDGGARRILGAFSSPEDVTAMDDALDLAMTDRQNRNSRSPHG